MQRVYLDNAATTPMAPEVIKAMTDVLTNNFGNPSSTHRFGREAKAIIENARRNIGAHINAAPAEIIFTSGGTEADNMAINSAVKDLGVTRIISTSIEHHAVGHTIDAHAETEFVALNLCKKGNPDYIQLEELLKDGKPTLVSLMHANNEIGTLLDIKRVSELCRKYNAYFHSDTVQTMGHYNMDVKEMGCDFITCSAHKFHGPKGIGFLYVNKGLNVNPIIQGGSQERGKRGGTENISGIAGLNAAMDLAYEDVEGHEKHVSELKQYMIAQLKEQVPGVNFHGETDPNKSLYTVLNVCLPDFENKSMFLFLMDIEGVACSGGSACTSGSNTGSHVLRGIDADTNRPNVRFSFSRYTTKEDIDFALSKVVKLVVEQNVTA
ncbi:MAG: cysteine desulfurase [Crocinitomicaceae bacterium]|nr:cysteine desulfurase [Crocinitomicaceae bacterium]